MSALWANIPQEMQNRDQWAICKGGSGKDAKIPRNLAGEPISSTDPTQWLEFNDAVNRAHELSWQIGYMLHDSDPFTVFDLDVKDSGNESDESKWTSKNQYDLYYRILREFDSYTEFSISGKGYHLVIKGKGRSGRRDGVEVYSTARFIICTGNAVNNVPIRDWQAKLNIFCEEMFRVSDETSELEELSEVESDPIVIDRIMRSSNGAKFNALASGNWQAFDYPSQSEADLATIGMIAFFTASNEQCRRIFRMTLLGRREKAVKNNYYLDLSLKQVRAKQKASALIEDGVDFSALIESANQSTKNVSAINASPFEASPPLASSIAIAAPTPDIVTRASSDGLDWPPGLAGKIAHFMYGAAPRPVKEVAIVSTLGMLAGICGKAFSIPLSGLNLYIILVARSAVGKEAMHSSISILASHISKLTPHIDNYLSFTDFASGPALLKEVIGNPSVCNVAGEWGQKLLHIAKGEESNGPLATLRKEMTNLYQKSGANSIVGGLAYSNKDNNIASVTGVAYSMIGETTPETFYSAVTPSMMADGFMSRFLTIEYRGERPPLNKNQIINPDKALVESMTEIVNRAFDTIASSETVPVTRRPDADLILDAFEKECDRQINSTEDESRRQLWNRASLKALRVSALLAVADNWQLPVIRKEHANWAIQLVIHGIDMMETRIDSGEVGLGDSTREKKVISIIVDYLKKRPAPGYHISDDVYSKHIITRLYLSQRIGRTLAFDNYRLGSGKALDATIDHLIGNGILLEVDKLTLTDKLDVRGRAFQIVTSHFTRGQHG